MALLMRKQPEEKFIDFNDYRCSTEPSLRESNNEFNLTHSSNRLREFQLRNGHDQEIGSDRL